MPSEIEKLKEEFEKEIWFYIDNSLSTKRKNFWDEKLIDFPELKAEFKETAKVLDIYNEFSNEDLLDVKFETIINNAVQKKKNDFIKFIETENRTVKLAFGAMLAAASIVILLLSSRPNPVKNISADLLDWNAEKLNTKIDDIGNSLMFMKNNEAKEYFQEKLANDKWTRDVYNINKSIQKIKNEMKESSF